MTPKEKAKELVDRFYMGDDYPVRCGTYCEGGTPDYYGMAKQCALICVDEMKKQCEEYLEHEDYNYWEIVKQELLKQ